jgi:carbon-monoxide dehydrogenase small subunit
VSEFFTLSVNGRRLDVQDSWLGENLLEVLRDRLGLTGTKGACEQGECGSCSVLLDDDLVCSCLVMAVNAVGRHITTIEGLADSDAPSDVQQAFLDAGAVQCGFCTPGLVVAVHDLLNRVERPDETEVREELAGNICRCTGYGRILDAVARAVDVRSGER